MIWRSALESVSIWSLMLGPSRVERSGWAQLGGCQLGREIPGRKEDKGRWKIGGVVGKECNVRVRADLMAIGYHAAD